MKEFHRNYIYRPTELEKKVRRVKNQQKEVCKCFAPFVKLHSYDCPAVNKPCPVHGNFLHHGVKDKREQPEQNMIISFHPSSKTERLFRPVKTLLAQCNPQTKINLQYYSSKSTTSKENIKHQQVQTKSDDGKKSLNNNVFVEKTKSFVADKTNKMKKLKQCFHSPCNSIVQKSRSQTSIKEKHEIFRDDRKRMNDFVNMAPDRPPGDLKCDQNLTWFNEFDFKNWEKLSGGKTDSDFITVTQQTKNNVINHKIFEIKHKKGLNDFPFVRVPKQATHLVYSSSLDVERPMKKTRVYSDVQEEEQLFKKENSPPSEGSRENDSKQTRDEGLSSSENSETSSRSSVYFTPYIFDLGAPDNDSHGKTKVDAAIQVGSEERGEEKTPQEAQTPSFQMEDELVSLASDDKTKSILQQTDLDRQSGDSATPEWYLRQVEVAESFTTRGTQTDESLFRLHKRVGDSKPLSESSFEDSTLASRNEVGDYYDRSAQTSASPADFEALRQGSGPTTRTVGVQMTSHRQEGVILNTTHWTMSVLDKIVQTESRRLLDVRRLWSLKVNKSQMAAPNLSNKTTQTIFSRSESLEEISEFIDMDSSNVTFVVRPFNKQESDQVIDKLAKAWWGKSHSDSELYGTRRCGCLKPEYVIPLPQDCICNESEATRQSPTPAKQYQNNTDSHSSNIANDPFHNAKILKSEIKKDKALGTDNGAQRSYRRADKGLGTDSGVHILPGMSGTADKALGTDSGFQKVYARVDKALGTDSEVDITPGTSGRAGERIPAAMENKADRSPRKTEYVSKAEQASLKEEDPYTPVSDLSELTRIIQEFFEKTSMRSMKRCACETSVVSVKKTDGTMTVNSVGSRKEYDSTFNTRTFYERKVDSEDIAHSHKKPKTEVPQATSSSVKGEPREVKLGNLSYSDRVKIRRSVLLDDNQTKTRFICSVCAREISTFSTNAATNTENPQNSPRKKEKPTSADAEISELVKIKTVRTVQSVGAPERLTSAPEPTSKVSYNDAKEGTSQSKPPQDFPRNSYKSYLSIPRIGAGVNVNGRMSREMLNPQLDRLESVKRTATTTLQKPPILKGCICNEIVKNCDKDSCPHRAVDPNAPSTSRAAPQKTDNPSLPRSDRPVVPNSQSRTNKRAADRSRTQRRAIEPFYHILLESHWPRELFWNVTDKSCNSNSEECQRTTSQSKGSYEREKESAGTHAGKKMKDEFQKPSKKYLMFGNPTSPDFRVEDITLSPSKAGFICIPSFSTSDVAPPNNSTLGQSKTKSEEKVWDANQQNFVSPQEGLDGGDSPDLFAAKSCRLTPIAFECDDKQPFDNLFEYRVCKSLTLIKGDRDDVVYHWPHAVLACRPRTPEDQSPTGPNADFDEDPESSHGNESSTQDLEKLLEECSRLYGKSDSPSTEELLVEEPGEATEGEEPEAFSALDETFYSNGGVSSKSFNKF